MTPKREFKNDVLEVCELFYFMIAAKDEETSEEKQEQWQKARDALADKWVK